MAEDDVTAAVGHRVRAGRAERGWTLDDLAERSGVSRRMIVNVEAGTTNASITTLLRLARAMGTTLAELVAEPTGEGIVVSRASDRDPLWVGEGGGAAVLVAAAQTPDMLELWDWTLEPGDAYASEPHRAGTHELLHVLSGTLTLTVDDETVELPAGAATGIGAEVPHTYANRGRRRVRFAMTVFEPVTRRRV